MTDLTPTLTGVASTFLAYTAGHALVDRVWQVAAPARYASLSRRDRIYLAEKVSSSVNAVVVSALGAATIFGRRGEYSNDLMHAYPLSAHHAFVHLCGYTIYDLGTMWMQGGDHWSMWVHHIMSAYGTSLIMYYKNPSFFPLLFGVSEITALANNVVWYLQTLRPSSRSLPYVLMGRAIMFTVARVWIGPYALMRMLAHAEWSPRKLVAQWFEDPDMSRVASVLTLVNVLTIAYFNVGWTIAVWKLAIRGWNKSSKVSSTAEKRHQ
ncbi:hypothetical protein BC828DRAFT_380412 [Blastocladiella britannica]|nr:hypothetical protein BC828DRAFT_380412 [Blastocladiella britannica]